MPYHRSQLDISNTNWFNNDKSRNSLRSITIENGQIRGVTPVTIRFDYPISALVGENGAGKSTILALTSCSFHNDTDFFPQNRIRLNAKKPRNYYTYGDFFTFSSTEHGIESVEITSEYLSSSGIKKDVRRKKPSGKWNDFNTRPKRAVTYLGINRIVPPSESNPHRHYSRNFSNRPLTTDQLTQLKNSMSTILGRNYSQVELLEYNTYRLFSTHRNGLFYTGFNMGAGENAVLGLLLELLTAGPGALIVVDEIELGLHAQAQARLIEELKLLCLQKKCQIICSTHSKSILERLPPEARIFLKRSDDKTDIIPNVSPEFAFGKLSGFNTGELDVFVEDDVGQAFLDNVFPQSIRERIHIFPIGSDQAVLKHISSHYREHRYNFAAFLDGDKQTQKQQAINAVKDHLEDRLDHGIEEFKEFIGERLLYLPGRQWPEKELIEETLRNNLDALVDIWESPKEDIIAFLEQALTAGKHNEFYNLSNSLCLPLSQVRADIIKNYKRYHNDIIASFIDKITAILEKQ